VSIGDYVLSGGDVAALDSNPQNRMSALGRAMSALCQKQTLEPNPITSAICCCTEPQALALTRQVDKHRRLCLPQKGPRQMTFTERGFRDALGLFPTGVAVVTTVTKDDTRIGATVSSFNSVSLSPPLVLFSIARTSRSFAAWSDADTYAINLLHEHQHAVSTRFARSLAEKWEGVVPLVGHTGVPLIPGALASFECENYARHDGGDHLILVGKVCALTTATAADVRPLIFYRGSYQKIERDYDPNTPSDFYYLLNGW
jgi:flavin reductase (DIM6/NTAB) family NADH-FMN oxidoreductase RutF